MRNVMHEQYQKELAVCGLEAVTALSIEHPEKISRLFFTGNRAKRFGTLCKYLAQKKRLYRLVGSDSELEKLCTSVHHQGVVAMIAFPVIPAVTAADVRRWAQQHEAVLMLDRIGNANNFGAIIRSAAFFGITEIIISGEEAQAYITTSAYRIAQGGMEFVHLYTAPSAERFLQDCEGFLFRIGADHQAYRRLQDIPAIVKKDEAVTVVLGNEEHGISPEAKKQCDTLIKIPGSGAIESLNVAQAGTLFCSALAALRNG